MASRVKDNDYDFLFGPLEDIGIVDEIAPDGDIEVWIAAGYALIGVGMVVVIVLALRANERKRGGAGHEPGLAMAAGVAAAVFAALGVIDYVLIVVAAIFVWMTLWLSRTRAITFAAAGIVVACAIAAPVASAVLENREQNPDPPAGELFARGLRECKPAAGSAAGGTDRPYTQLIFSDGEQEEYGPLRCADLTAELRDPAVYDRCVRQKQGEHALGLETEQVQECIDRSGLKR